MKKLTPTAFTLFLLCISFASADIISTGGSGGEEIILGYGNQIDLFFSGISAAAPVVSIVSPASGLSTYEADQLYIYSVSTSKSIIYCSLLINGETVSSDTDVEETVTNAFSYLQSVGSYTWSIICVDEDFNSGSTGNYTIEFTDHPGWISGGGGRESTECYSLIDYKCELTKYYDEECPEGYYLSLSECIGSMVTDKINKTTIDKVLDIFSVFDLNDTTKTENVTNKIPKDINKYLSSISSKMSPSHQLLAKYIIILFMICIIFSKEIIRLIKNIKVKDMW